METNRMMLLHQKMNTPKTKPEPDGNMIILDQKAAKELLGL